MCVCRFLESNLNLCLRNENPTSLYTITDHLSIARTCLIVVLLETPYKHAI